MSVIGSNALAGASGQAAGGYNVERSLRFNSSDSAYLSRTPSTAGNRKTWTWAGWLKRSGTSRDVLFARFSGTSGFSFEIDSSSLRAYDYTSTAFDWQLISTPVFRDPSAWYHIVFTYDTTQATASNRVKIYVNGAQVTTFSTETYPTQNYDGYVNTTSAHEIGGAFTVYLDGYLADIHFIDGQALTPSSFTEVSATTGQLIPKAYSGPTPTGNSSWLPFSDNSAATATTLGKDNFNLGNNWTPNNLSVTAGAGNDSFVDTPTSYGTDDGLGGSVRGNYATLNPLNSYSAGLSNGNLQLAQTTNSWVQGNSTIGVSSGKWYWEVTWTSGTNILNGITKSPLATSYVGATSDSWGWAAGGSYYNGGSSAPYGGSLVVGDVTGVALNMDAGTLTFYRNGVSEGVLVSGLSGTFFAAISVYGTTTENINFGQRPFAHPVSGFKALCDTNLPAPVVAKSSDYFQTVLYTGNGSTQTISGLGFSPDFVWAKVRSNSTWAHRLFDTIRGATKEIFTNTTDAEVTRANGLTAFNSDGFTLGDHAGINESGQTFVAWAWDAGSSTVTNTQGSITSSVRTNGYLSIVTYTGNGTNPGATIGHGLGVNPALIITKARSASSTWWPSYHSALPISNTLYLNSTVSSTTYINRFSAVSSTTFTTGSSGSELNDNGVTYVAYCFAPVAGYSSGFSFTGNGSTDGSFVYLGFRPRLILLKCSSTTGNWTLLDTAREGYNVDNDPLYPNLSNAEGTTDLLDITSNGFKLRTTDASVNSSGATYVGYAWAEAPFAYSRAR